MLLWLLFLVFVVREMIWYFMCLPLLHLFTTLYVAVTDAVKIRLINLKFDGCVVNIWIKGESLCNFSYLKSMCLKFQQSHLNGKKKNK